MVKVKADDVVTAFLGPIKERAEVLDPQGNLPGHFIPFDVEMEILRRKAFADHESGDYQRRKELSKGQPGFATEQVLERLRSLGTP